MKLGSSRPGHWSGREEARLAGSRKGVKRAAELRTIAARRHNSMAVEAALKLREEGMSWQDIANTLNARGLVTRRGNAWSKSSVFTATKAAAGCVVTMAGSVIEAALV